MVEVFLGQAVLAQEFLQHGVPVLVVLLSLALSVDMNTHLSYQFLQQQVLQGFLLFPCKLVIGIGQGHFQEALAREDALVELFDQSS